MWGDIVYKVDDIDEAQTLLSIQQVREAITSKSVRGILIRIDHPHDVIPLETPLYDCGLNPSARCVDLTICWSCVPRIFSTAAAFCALESSGEIRFAWGSPRAGGDCSDVKDRLTNVVDVCEGMAAFAALMKDGAVVCWGDKDFGGDSSILHGGTNNVSRKVDDSLVRAGIRKVCASWYAFAALSKEGRIHTWGYTHFGAGHDGVSEYLRDKKCYDVIAGVGCFCAQFDNKTTWIQWEDSEAPYRILEDVYSIHMLKGPFINDGVVVSASDHTVSHVHSNVIRQSEVLIPPNEPIDAILAMGMYASVARTRAGSIVAWGEKNLGGDLADTNIQGGGGLKQVINNWGAFAAIKDDNTVVAWGADSYGGSVPDQISDVVELVSFIGGRGFVAIKSDRSAISWGGASGPTIIDNDHSLPPKSYWLQNIEHVHSVVMTTTGFVVVHLSGEVSSWGLKEEETQKADWEIDVNTQSAIRAHGGAVSVTQTKWNNIIKQGYACPCLDGTIVYWGNPSIVPAGNAAVIEF